MKLSPNLLIFFSGRALNRFKPTCLLLSVLAVWTAASTSVQAQFRIPGVKLPDISGLKIPGVPEPNIPGLDSLFKEEDPVTTSIKDVRGEVPYLDGYAPKRFRPLSSLRRGPNGGWLLQPGLYSGDIRTYCLHAGTYGPTRGSGYLYAPLMGKQRSVIRKILHNSADHPELQQHEIQSLIWAIEARAKISSLPTDLQQVASTLLPEQDIMELNGMSIDYLSDQVKDKAFGRLNSTLRPIYEAQNNLRGLLTQANAPFDQLERVAVLSGDPPRDRNSREIPEGRWTLHPGGFYVRYRSSSYSRTTLQLCVPDRSRIVRDAKGRIASVMDARGNGVETDYTDTPVPPALGVRAIQSFPFASIRLIRADIMADGKSNHEYRNVGWMFTGSPAGGNVSAGDHPGSDARLRSSMGVRHQLEDIRKSYNKNGPAWGDPIDAVDLANYRAGIVEALKGDGAPETFADDTLTRAWQSATSRWAVNLPDRSDAPIPEGTEYDPSDDVATPCENGRQRLGQSIVPCDPSSDQPSIGADHDFAGDVVGGSLDRCFRDTYGNYDNFWVRGGSVGGHKYLAINSLGKPSLEAAEAMTILKNNIVSIFPYGAEALDGPTVKVNNRFTVTARLPGPSNVICTSAGADRFVFQTIPGQHLLRGTVTFGIFKDSCGELWLFQQGRGPADEGEVRAVFNYATAQDLWESMADNLAAALRDHHSP